MILLEPRLLHSIDREGPSIECLLLSCLLLSPLSQQEDTITDFSLPNARGFSLSNLASALNCTAQFYFGIDKVPSYHVASHVFTRVRVWVGECFLSRQHKLVLAFAAGSKLLFANCACECRVERCVETNTPSGVVTCFSPHWSRLRWGPLPAGTRGPVSSAFGCEFHVSHEGARHAWHNTHQHHKIHSPAFLFFFFFSTVQGLGTHLHTHSRFLGWL